MNNLQYFQQKYGNTQLNDFQEKTRETQRRAKEEEERKRKQRELEAKVATISDMAKQDKPHIDIESVANKPSPSIASADKYKQFSQDLARDIEETRSLKRAIGKSDSEIDKEIIPDPDDDTVMERLAAIENKLKRGKESIGYNLQESWLEKEAMNILSEEAVKAMNGLPNRMGEVDQWMDNHPEIGLSKPDDPFMNVVRGLADFAHLTGDIVGSSIQNKESWVALTALLGANTLAAGALSSAATAGATATAGAGLLASPLLINPATGLAIGVTATAAAAAGMTYGTWKRVSELAAGLNYNEYIKQGMHPEVAKNRALTTGVLEGLSETVEIGSLFTGVPGAGKAVAGASKALKKSFADKMIKAARAYGINLGSNVLEEIIQETISYSGGNAPGIDDAIPMRGIDFMDMSKYFEGAPNPETIGGLKELRKTMDDEEYFERIAQTAYTSALRLAGVPIATGIGRVGLGRVASSIESKAQQKAERGWYNQQEAMSQAAMDEYKKVLIDDDSAIDQMAEKVRKDRDDVNVRRLLGLDPLIDELLARPDITNEEREKLSKKSGIIKEVIAEIEYEAKSGDNTINYDTTDKAEILDNILSGNIELRVIDNDTYIETYKDAQSKGIVDKVKSMKSEGKSLSEIADSIKKLLPKKQNGAVEAHLVLKSIDLVESEVKVQRNLALVRNFNQVEGTLNKNKAPEQPTTNGTEVSQSTDSLNEENTTTVNVEPEKGNDTVTPIPKEPLEVVEGKYEPSDIVRVPLSNIKIDQKKYQFRFNGTTDKLAGMEWDDNLAGVVSLHENEYGDLYALDGHHRILEGQQRGIKDIRAKIYKGITAEEARAQGALLNIAQGNADAFDTAKFLRDTNSTLEDLTKLGVPPKSKIARDGANLAKLEDNLFHMAAVKKIPYERAVMIGRELEDKVAQRQFYDMMVKEEAKRGYLKDSTIDAMLNQVKAVGAVEYFQESLLGADDTRSAVVERAELVGYVKDNLKNKKSVLKKITKTKNTRMLEQLGNKIRVDDNVKEMELADQALYLLDKTVNAKDSKVSQMFNDLAIEYAKTGDKKVLDKALKMVGDLMESGELLQEAFGKDKAKTELLDTLEEQLDGQADLFGQLAQLKNEPAIKVRVKHGTDTETHAKLMPLIEIMEKNPIFNGLEIVFTGQASDKFMDRSELDAKGYRNAPEGRYITYGWYESGANNLSERDNAQLTDQGDSTRDQLRDNGNTPKKSTRGRISLNNSAQVDTLLHEAIHSIQDILYRIDPEFEVLVKDWEKQVNEIAREQGIVLPQGREMLTHALMLGEFGYANDNPALAKAVEVPTEIVDQFKAMLGKQFVKEAMGDNKADPVRAIKAEYKKLADVNLQNTEVAESIARARQRRLNKIKMDLKDKQPIRYYSPDTTTYAIAIPKDTDYEVSFFNEEGLLTKAVLDINKLAKKLSDMKMYYNPGEISYQLKQWNRDQIDSLVINEKPLSTEEMAKAEEVVRLLNNARVGNFTASDYDNYLKDKLNNADKQDVLRAIMDAAEKGLDKPNSEVTIQEYVNRFYPQRLERNDYSMREREGRIEFIAKDYKAMNPYDPDAKLPIRVLGDYATAKEAIEGYREWLSLDRTPEAYKRSSFDNDFAYMPDYFDTLMQEYEDFRDNVETYRHDYSTDFDGQMKFNISYQVKKADIDTEEFKQWFKDSKVVDENGNPMIVYHGSLWKFDTFKGEMIFFSTTKDFAEGYADQKAFDGGIDNDKSLYEAYLSVQNIFDYRNEEHLSILQQALDSEINLGFNNKKFTPSEIIDKIRGDQEIPPYWTPEQIANAKYARPIGDASDGYNTDLFVADRDGYVYYAWNRDRDALSIMTEDMKEELIANGKIEFKTRYANGTLMLEENYQKMDKTEIWGNDYLGKTQKISISKTPKQTTILSNQDNWHYFEMTFGWANKEDTVSLIKRLGFDGIIMQENDNINYAVFKPTQIKSIYNNGQFSLYDPNINYQLKSAIDVEGFYSNLEKVLDTKMGSRGKAQDILNMLNKNGVKPEELEWFRIADFLADKDFVTKEEILEHMQERRIEFSKVNIGTNFKEYTLHKGQGGSNYKFNAYVYKNNPGKAFTKQGHFGNRENVIAHTRYMDRTTQLGEKVLFIEELQSDWHQEGRDKGYSEETLSAQDRLALSNEQKSLYEQLNIINNENGMDWVQYKSIEGEVEYLDEEIKHAESELANLSRNEGNAEEISTLMEEIQENQSLKQNYQSEMDIMYRDTIGKYQNEIDAIDARIKEIDTMLKIDFSDTVADAPLKESIVDFMFKSVIKDAVEGGYDRIAWTTGEQQADRYNMREIVDEIEWQASDSFTTTGTLIGKEKGAEVFTHYIDQSEVQDYIGKSLATELFGQEAIEDESLGEGYAKILYGDALEIGGEFHKKLYNNYIPRMVKKYAKKWGISPEVVTMGLDYTINERSLMQLSFPELGAYASSLDLDDEYTTYRDKYFDNNNSIEVKEYAKEKLVMVISEALQEAGSITTQQLSIPVTPQMIEDVMSNGQPLFQIKELVSVHDVSEGKLKSIVKVGTVPKGNMQIIETNTEPIFLLFTEEALNAEGNSIALDELQAVIMPLDTGPELIQMLKDRGIHFIEFYDKSIEGDRQRAMDEVLGKNDVSFQIKPTSPWSAESIDEYYQLKDEPQMEERSWSQTVKDAELTQPWLKEMLVDNRMMYEVKHNSDSFIAGAKLLDKHGVDYIVGRLESDFEATADLIGAAMILQNYYQFNGDENSAFEIVRLTAQKVTTAGQAIQILASLNKMSPDGMVRHFSKEFDKITTPAERKNIERVTERIEGKARKANADAVDKADLNTVVNKVRRTTKEEMNIQTIARSDKKTKAYVDGEQITMLDKTEIDEVMGQMIIDTIKEHYKTGKGSLFGKLGRLGLNEFEARMIVKYTKEQMRGLTDEQMQQILNEEGNANAVDTSIKDLISEGSFGEALKQMVGQKKGIPVFTKEMADMVYQRGQDIAKMLPGREKDVEMAKLVRDISEQMPVTLGRKVNTFRILSMLLTAKTTIRNLLGNRGFRDIDTFTLNTVGVGLDKLIFTKTKQRTQLARLADAKKRQKEGYQQGWKYGKEDALLGIDTFNQEDKFNIGQRRTFNRGTPLGQAETALSILLRATDRAAYTASFMDSLEEQTLIAGIAEPTEQMIENAHMLGLYRTFNDSTKISEMFTTLKKGLNKVGTDDFGLGDLVMPFPKTPGNIMARAIDYSPVGLILTTVKLFGDHSGDPYIKQRMAVEGYSRAIMGSGLIGIGMQLAAMGILTGSEPDDDEDLYNLQKQAGLRDYSVNLSAIFRYLTFQDNAGDLRRGDNLASYDWFQPISMGLAIGADTVLGKGEALDLISTIIRSTEAGVTTLTEQPLFTGLANLFRYGDPVQGLTQILKSMPASFTPSVISQVAQAIDGRATDPYSFYPTSKQAWNLIMNRVPGARSTLPGRVGVLGNEQMYFPDDELLPISLFKSMISPSILTQYMPSEEAEFISDLYEQTGDKEVIPRKPQKQYTIKNSKGEKMVVKPTPEEWEEWSRWLGESTRKEISIAMNGYMKGWSAEEQADEVRFIIDTFRDELKYRIEKQY